MTGFGRSQGLLTGVLLVATTALLPLTPAVGEGDARRDIVRHSAESAADSAAPASLSKNATIMDREGKVLRKGTNGWMCVPDNPDTPGTDPMCMNEPWIGF
jgi:hypothetical protein